MKIILNQDVYNLGEEGDVCDVARGYARNYLVPKKLAVVFNNATKAQFESRKTIIEDKKDFKRKEAMSLKERLEDISLIVKMSAGESGKLFGAVTSATIADALAREGVEVERKKIEVPSHHIKMVGTYQIKVRLYEQESAELKVVIDSDRKQAEKPAEAPKAAAKQEPVKAEETEETETPQQEA